MKFLLTPVTVLLWYLTAYFGLYFAFIAMAFMFKLSWLWIIIGYTFLSGLILGITNVLPTFLRFYILKFYNFNWFSIIIHSVAGAIGTFELISFFISNPPVIVDGTFFLTSMWDIAPVKTIFLAFPSFGLALSLIWSTVIAPIYIKISDGL